jgi:molecular chaperone GrpE (heat shock protein)
MPNDKRSTPNSFKKHPLLYGLTATILIISLVGLAVAILPISKYDIDHNILLVISAIYLLAGCSFFLWIYQREQDQQFVSVLPEVIDEVKKVSRVYYNNTSAIQENSESVQKLHNSIEQEIGRLAESNKNIEKILIDMRQEKRQLQDELDNWNQSSIEFFELLKRGLETEENNECRNVFKRNIKEFEIIVNNRGLSRISPSINDRFYESEHDCKGEELSSDVEEDSILKCVQWGYRSGREVLRKAEVILAKKPEIKVDSAQEEIPREDAKDIEAES